MKHWVVLLMVLAASTGVVGTQSSEPSTGTEQEPAVAPPGSGSPSPATSPTSPTSDEERQAQIEEELEEFVPSEQVSADSAISFPTDI